MNRYKRFRRLIGLPRLMIVTVNSVRPDKTSVVETPDGRVMRVRNAPGVGVPAGSRAYVRTQPHQMPELYATAPNLPLTRFINL